MAATSTGNILEHAGSVTFENRPTFVQGDVAGGVIRTRVVDQNLKGDFTFIFPFATDATIAAVLLFARDFAHGTFPIKIPDPGGSGFEIFAEIVEPPDIRRVGPRQATVSVRVRRALLVDVD